MILKPVLLLVLKIVIYVMRKDTVYYALVDTSSHPPPLVNYVVMEALVILVLQEAIPRVEVVQVILPKTLNLARLVKMVELHTFALRVGLKTGLLARAQAITILKPVTCVRMVAWLSDVEKETTELVLPVLEQPILIHKLAKCVVMVAHLTCVPSEASRAVLLVSGLHLLILKRAKVVTLAKNTFVPRVALKLVFRVMEPLL